MDAGREKERMMGKAEPGLCGVERMRRGEEKGTPWTLSHQSSLAQSHSAPFSASYLAQPDSVSGDGVREALSWPASDQ